MTNRPSYSSCCSPELVSLELGLALVDGGTELLIPHGLVGGLVNVLGSGEALLGLRLGLVHSGRRASGETNRAAAESSAVGTIEHNGAADNGLGAGKVDIGDEVEGAAFECTEGTWSFLTLSFSCAGFADAGVEHITN